MTTLLPTEPTLSTVLVLMMTSNTTIPTPLLPPTVTTCRITPIMSRRWSPHSQLATTTTTQEEQEFTAPDTLAAIRLGLCLRPMLMCLSCTRRLLGNLFKILSVFLTFHCNSQRCLGNACHLFKFLCFSYNEVVYRKQDQRCN